MKLLSTSTCVLLATLGSLLWTATAETQKEGSAPLTPLSEEEKTIYALGLALARNTHNLSLTEAEVKILVDGLTDAVLRRETRVALPQYGPRIATMMKDRTKATVARETEASAPFLQEEAAKPGAVTTESGLVFIAIQDGKGASPKATDTVTVHYHGTLRDGTVFDSSIVRGEPTSFPLNRVIPGWTEGLQRMKVGGKARLVCPAKIAYGDNGSPAAQILGGTALAFDVELIAIDGGESGD